MDDNSPQIPMIVGRLIATTEATNNALEKNTKSLENFSTELHKLALSFSELQDGLVHTNNDIMQIRNSLLTKDHLRRAGIDIDDALEIKADMDHLRELRASRDEAKPVNQNLKVAIISAVIIGILTTSLGYISDHVSYVSNKIDPPEVHSK